MDYKLIAIDGDGTLLCRDLSITDENKEAIRYAKKKGVHVAICSGRSYASLKCFAETAGLDDEGDYVISFNGAVILDAFTGRVLYENKLKAELARSIISGIKKAKNENTDFIVYDDIYSTQVEQNSLYVEAYASLTSITVNEVENLETAIDDVYKILLVGPRDELNEVEAFANTLGYDVNIFFSGENLLEILPRETTKAVGIAFVADKLGIPMEQVIAIGDHFNDVSMIKTAGMGIAMANAEPEVKTYADYVTENSNNDSGVAEAIYKFV